jgi:HEAT repeats
MAFFGLLGSPNVPKMYAQRNIEGLIKALDYRKRTDVREAAAVALGRLSYSVGARAVKPLITALEDDAPSVRQAASNALVAIGQVQKAWSILPMSTGLVYRDAAVQEAVVDVLLRIGGPDAHRGLLHYYTQKPKKEPEKLKQDVHKLVDILRTVGSFASGHPIQLALVSMGPAAVPWLIELVQLSRGQQDSVIPYVIDTLERIKDTRAGVST